MQTPTEHIYYNPFDRRCWKAIAIGLPLLLIAIAALAMVGWMVRGHSAATGPDAWLYKPWLPAAYALLGAYVVSIATGLAWTVGLIAHAIGRGAFDAVTSHIRR